MMPIDAPAFREFIVASPEITSALWPDEDTPLTWDGVAASAEYAQRAIERMADSLGDYVEALGGDPLPATKCRACHDYHDATVDCLRPVTVQQPRRWRWVLVAVAVVILAWRVS